MKTQNLQPDQQKPERQSENQTELTRDSAVYVPRVDIWEQDDKLVLLVDMPGVNKDGLDIQFEDRTLTIHGKVDNRHQEASFIGGEYGIGDFYRTFTIGESIEPSGIEAELKQGVLTLHLPKSEAARPRRIKVQAG